MAKILDSTRFTSTIAKLVELDDEFIINGCGYTKTNLSPKAIDFAAIPSSNNCMILKEMAHIQNKNDASCYHTENGYVQDIEDSEVSYVLAPASTGGASNYFYKVVRKDDKTTVYSFTLNNSYDLYFKIIGQDSQKVYIFNCASGSKESAITYFDKKTNTLSGGVGLSAYGETAVLKETDLYIYLVTRYSTRIYIYRYNKTSHSMTVILDDNIAGAYPFDVTPTDMTQDGVFYNVYDKYTTSNKTHYAGYKRYKLDTSNDNVVVEKLTVDASRFDNIEIPLMSGQHSKHMLKTFTANGKEYLYHLNFCSAKVNLDAKYLKLYLYELADDTLTLIDVLDFNGFIPHGALTSNGNKTLILGGLTSINFYSFDMSEEKMKLTNTYVDSIFAIGKDANNNVYIQSSDSSVEMLSPVIGIDATATFEKESYDYKGVDIGTHIEVFVRNYLGEYLNSNIQVNLSGSVTFADGTKSKVVTTSNLNPVQIPVIIKDSGMLKVTTKLI